MKLGILITMLLLAGISTAIAAPTTSAVPASSNHDLAATKAHQVELFVTDWCPYCKKAEEYLKSRNIPYIRHDVEEDPIAARRKVQLGGGSGVPFALIDGRAVSGFKASTYKMLLGR